MKSWRLEEEIAGSEEGVAREVEAHVRRQLGGRVSDLRVIVRDGGLVLQGRTRTYHAKQLAQQAVIETAELPIRANEIQV
jgi:hypothetical protein